MNKYISKNEFARQYGLPLHTVSNWMRRYWLRDFHYTVIGRMTMIHVPRVETWLDKYFLPTEIYATNGDLKPRKRPVRKATSREEIERVLRRPIK